MARRSYAGGAAALTLTGGTLAAGGLSFTTAGTYTGWPDGSGGKFLVVIDRGAATEEKLFCSARVTNTFTVAAVGDRGKDGTTAQNHLVNAPIEHVVGAIDLDEANAHVNDTTTDVHPQYTTAAELAAGLSSYTLTTIAFPVGIAAWASYTPTLTNLTAGDGTNAGWYMKIGRTVHWHWKFTWGSTSAITSTPVQITLPAAPGVNYAGQTPNMGLVACIDTGGSTSYGAVWLSSGSTCNLQVFSASGTYLTGATISATVPHVWNATDVIEAWGTYEAAT